MATFEEAALALNPIHFWRLDELSGPTMFDTAVDGVNGTYFAEADVGRPSPVETDPASSAIGKRVGRAVAPAPPNNWSYGGFVYLNPTLDTYLICRSGQVGLAGGNFILWDAGAGVLRGHVSAGRTNITLNHAPSTLSTWVWVILARNGTTVSMYVNDALGDTSALFTGSPMGSDWLDGGQFTADGGWKIGCGGDTGNLGNLGDAIDEPMIFDYPLTLAESTSIRQAAINSLSLNGYSNVVTSAVLYSGVEPTPISFASMRHNWSDDLIERISFSTGVSTAIKGYEQGNGQRIKPRREIEISQLLRNDAERRAFRAKLNTQQNRKWFIPILEDRTRLTTAIASGVNVFALDTLYRDYEIGGHLGIRQLNDAGAITASEELLISGLTNTQITTATTTVNSYTTPELYPVRRAVISESVSLRGHTDSVEDTTILARLIAEDEKVVPHRIVEWTPATTYLDHEVFPVDLWPNNWNELRDYNVDRTRSDVDFDLGSFIPQSDSIGASETFSWRIILQTKQQQAEFLGWFYARAGSLNYLWVPTMQRDFDIIDVDGAELTVARHNYIENYAGSEYRRDIAFVYNDNSVELRRIESVALDGVNEVLSLETSIPTLTSLRSVSYALFCRLDNDTIEIARATDTKSQIAWLFRENLSSPE